MKKNHISLLICLVFCTLLTACSLTTTSRTTPSGFLVEPGSVCTIDSHVLITYEVIKYDGELVSVIDEAEAYVRQWWNDNATFSRPTIVWCHIIEGNIRGFQDVGYIFLDPRTTREDLLATVVHEWLHNLVARETLVAENDLGREIMEMVVESITVDILDDVVEVIPTPSYECFVRNKELWEHKVELQTAFRASQGFEAYEEIFGERYMEVIERAYKELP